MTGFRTHPCPKLMEALGFVSKNVWLEKADCTDVGHGSHGILIPHPAVRDE